MAGTYCQLLMHVVFSTKHRRPWLSDDISGDLYKYIGGIIRDEKGSLLEIGGIEDHIHLYVRWRPDESVSNLMREIKAGSSRWIHEHYPKMAEFAWQEGYSAFSVSLSNEESVRRYIKNQKEHHAKFDFKAELRKLLEAHQIEFDERYLF